MKKISLFGNILFFGSVQSLARQSIKINNKQSLWTVGSDVVELCSESKLKKYTENILFYSQWIAIKSIKPTKATLGAAIICVHFFFNLSL